jgi:hypothetical protein
MPLTDKIRGKLMSPLKNALLGFAVSVSPGVLTRESEKTLGAAVEKIAEDIAENTAQNFEEQLKNFGPNKGPTTNAANPSEDIPAADNFPDTPKNDIMPDKNIAKALEAEAATQPNSPTEEANSKPKSSEENSTEQGNLAAQGEQQGTGEKKEKNPNETPEEKAEREQEEAEEKAYQEELEAARKKLPSGKGALTQTLNSLINRQKIKKLEKQLAKLGANLKQWQRELDKKKKILSRTEKQKARLENKKKRIDKIRKFLRVFNWTAGFLIFFWTLEITIPWKKALDAAALRLEQMIAPLEEKIKTIKKVITVIEKQIKIVQRQMTEITMKIYALYNQGLFEQRNTPQGNAQRV